MNILHVVPSIQHARDAGYLITRRHPKDENLWCWWPGLERDSLRGRVWDLIIIDSGARVNVNDCQAIGLAGSRGIIIQS